MSKDTSEATQKLVSKRQESASQPGDPGDSEQKAVRKRKSGKQGRKSKQERTDAQKFRAELKMIKREMDEAHKALQEIPTDAVPEQYQDITAQYWQQAKQTLVVTQRWLDYLGSEKIMLEKFERTPPHMLAITYSVLSDQVLKRIKEFREVAKEINSLLNPQQPVIEIVQADTSHELLERGLGMMLRYVGYEDGKVEFATPNTSVELGGKKFKFPVKVEIPAKLVST